MNFRSVKRARTLKGKTVLVRVDFNVPVHRRKILDDTKMRAALPGIQRLLEKGAKVVLVTHLGRPGGKKDAKLSTEPLAQHLSDLLGKKVTFFDAYTGEDIKKSVKGLRAGHIAMLENIRFSPEEHNNTGTLGEDLASIADVFVLDGFGVAHRGDASIVGVPAHVKSYAGELLETELEALDHLMYEPAEPFVLVLGGAKIETKLPIMHQFMPIADTILVGGGIVNTYLKAKGYKIGESLVDDDEQIPALKACKRRKVMKPVDVVVGKPDGSDARVVALKKPAHRVCKRDEAVLDIGPETVRRYKTYIESANTLVWNGAMGYFEQEPYDAATRAIAEAIAARSELDETFSVIGGGETLQAIDLVGKKAAIDHVSTGGGAMLSYLAGESLPGLVAIEK